LENGAEPSSLPSHFSNFSSWNLKLNQILTLLGSQPYSNCYGSVPDIAFYRIFSLHRHVSRAHPTSLTVSAPFDFDGPPFIHISRTRRPSDSEEISQIPPRVLTTEVPKPPLPPPSALLRSSSFPLVWKSGRIFFSLDVTSSFRFPNRKRVSHPPSPPYPTYSILQRARPLRT